MEPVTKQPIVNFAVFAWFVATAIPSIWLAMIGSTALEILGHQEMASLWSVLGNLPGVTIVIRIALAAVFLVWLLATYKFFQFLRDDDSGAKLGRMGKWKSSSSSFGRLFSIRYYIPPDMDSPVTASETAHLALEERPSFKYAVVCGAMSFVGLLGCAVLSVFLLFWYDYHDYRKIALVWESFGTCIVVSLVPYPFLRYYYDAFRNLKAKRDR